MAKPHISIQVELPAGISFTSNLPAPRPTDPFADTVGKTLAERSELEVVQAVQRKLDGEERKPVESKVLKEELLKTGKFASMEDVDKVVRKVFRERILYKAKPGYYKLVAG
jgi:hypothetical protein